MPAFASRLFGGKDEIESALDEACQQQQQQNADKEEIDMLCKLLCVPPGEKFTASFACALGATTLQLGRLYVFERYVCFHSGLLNLMPNALVIPVRSNHPPMQPKSSTP
jgi:hypothetical protein